MKSYIILMLLTIGWAFFDMSKNNIKKLDKPGYQLSKFEWVCLMLMLWFVFFPLYVYRRKDLINQAKISSVEDVD